MFISITLTIFVETLKHLIMEKLTLQEAKEYLERVKNIGENDNEVAHQIEDTCKNHFIWSISKSLYDYEELKSIAIIVDEITGLSYCRWYA